MTHVSKVCPTGGPGAIQVLIESKPRSTPLLSHFC